VISIWQNTSFRSRPPCLSPLRWVQSARAYGMHPALASGTPLCLFLEFQPTHRLLDKFRRNSPTRVFLSDSCRALYKDSYLSERLVCCLQDLNLRPPGPELGKHQPKSLSWRQLRFSGRSQIDKFGQVAFHMLRNKTNAEWRRFGDPCCSVHTPSFSLGSRWREYARSGDPLLCKAGP
jgi:hypothetical protein